MASSTMACDQVGLSNVTAGILLQYITKHCYSNLWRMQDCRTLVVKCAPDGCDGIHWLCRIRTTLLQHSLLLS